MIKIRNKYFLTILTGLVLCANILAQPVGRLINIGNTANENQNPGDPGRTIVIDDNGNAHLSWNGTIPTIDVLYNHYSPEAGVIFPLGTTICAYDGSYQSNIAITTDGRAAVTYIAYIDSNAFNAVAIQSDSSLAVFETHLLPTFAGGMLSVPRIAVDSRGWYHILAHFPEDIHNLNKTLYYNRSEDNCASWTGWTFIDTVRSVSADMAISPSGKIAFTWARPLNSELVSPLETVNNDIYFIESEDGSTPDFANAVNITGFETGTHPKSDSLRAFQDISSVYDNSEEIHIAYTCTGYIQSGGPIFTTPGSIIYHYSEQEGVSYITGALGSGPVPVPERRRYDRPSIGYSQTEDEIYIIWDEYSDPADTSGEGYRNGDICGAYSEDGGYSWSNPVNLTNTPSPGADPGQCHSEERPCLAAAVGDTLHIIYLVDSAPGANYGGYTFPVFYHQVSTEDFKASTHAAQINSAPYPKGFKISNPSPNPFNSPIKLNFSLSEVSKVSVIVYDVQGREITSLTDAYYQPGEHNIIWKPEHLSAGIYFAHFKSGNINEIRKIVLLK